MAHQVNLLPWRLDRQQVYKRIWIRSISLSVLVITLSTVVLHANTTLDRGITTLWQQSNAGILSALAIKQPHFQALHQQWLRQQAKAQRQRTTREWQQRLSELARTMPENAWLTEMHFRQGQFSVSGLARTFPALGEMEQTLRATRGFHLAQTGATQRDTEGRWQFHYQLNREGEDAQP